MVEEIPSGDKANKDPEELTLKKLNHLIKGQLGRFLLLPDDVEYNNKQDPVVTANNKANLCHNNGYHHITSHSQRSNDNNYQNKDFQPELIKRNGFNTSTTTTTTTTTTTFQSSNNATKNGMKIPSHLQLQPSSKDKPYQKSTSKQNKHTKSIYDLLALLVTTFFKILEVVLCDAIMLTLSPILLPLVILNFLIRWTITLYFRVKCNGKIRLMRGEDAFWASESSANPGNFTSMYVIEGHADLKKIREKLSSSWVEKKDSKGEPMFSKLKLRAVQRAGYFAWEFHEAFDINEHIRYLHPESPSSPTSEDGLFQEIQNIYDNLLPDNKPPWEILIVPNYIYNDPKLARRKHYAIIFRIHHSIMDGLSAAQALRMIVADEVVEAGIDPMKPLKASLFQKILTYVVAFLLQGRYVLRHNYVSDESNSFHGPSLTGPKSLGWSRPLRLEAVKKIKESTRTSVTAVFISCIGGAFRNLALSKGHSLPEKMTAVTCAALIPYPSIKAQNRFCVIFTPIAAKEKSALERAKIAQESFDNQLLAAAEVVMAYWITWIGGCFPIFILNWLQDGICHGTVLLSNLPGPLTTTKIFGGDTIVDIVGWSPIRNRIGIAMCLFGYNGRLRANVLADSSVFPDEDDVSKLIAEFEKELLILGNPLGLTDQDCFAENVATSNIAKIKNGGGFMRQKYISNDDDSNDSFPVSKIMRLD